MTYSFVSVSAGASAFAVFVVFFSAAFFVVAFFVAFVSSAGASAFLALVAFFSVFSSVSYL